MPSVRRIRCQVCGGTGSVSLAPARRVRTVDDIAGMPKVQVRSIPLCYRSGRLDLFALSKRRERLQRDLHNAYKRTKVAMERIADITQEMERIQKRLNEEEGVRGAAGA